MVVPEGRWMATRRPSGAPCARTSAQSSNRVMRTLRSRLRSRSQDLPDWSESPRKVRPLDHMRKSPESSRSARSCPRASSACRPLRRWRRRRRRSPEPSASSQLSHSVEMESAPRSARGRAGSCTRMGDSNSAISMRSGRAKARRTGLQHGGLGACREVLVVLCSHGPRQRPVVGALPGDQLGGRERASSLMRQREYLKNARDWTLAGRWGRRPAWSRG